MNRWLRPPPTPPSATGRIECDNNDGRRDFVVGHQEQNHATAITVT